MSKVIIRADGSKDIGMGHLNRCALIANYLQLTKNIGSVIVTINNPEAKSFIEKKLNKTEIFYIDDLSEHSGLSEIKDIVNTENISIIILDLLEHNLTNYYLNILKKNQLPIAAISDDSEYREIDVDLILNGNPNQEQFNYSRCMGKYLTGPSYFIMDPAYANSIIHKKNKGTRVLVTLGGSDHNNLIFKVLPVLIDSSIISEVIIITSQSTGYLYKLKNILNTLNGNIKLYSDVESLVTYWGICDVALTAGGNSLFERIASGIPGATICQLTRQMEIADKFEKIGVNKNIGFGPDLSNLDIKKVVNEFMNDKLEHASQIKKCRETVSGNGLRYFVDELCVLMGKNNGF